MKKVFYLLFALLLTITLLGCRGPGPDPEPEPEPEPEPGEKVSITFWNSITGADGTVMRSLISQFNKAQSEVEVIERFVIETTHYENLEMLVPLGQGPDVALMHSHRVYGYVNQELVIPFDSYLESSKVEIEMDDYVADVVSSTIIEDKQYAIPLDLHTVGVYYNKRLLNKYELAVPTNRAEFINAAKVVQDGERAAGNSNFHGLPLSNMWPSEWIFTTALFQNGGIEVSDPETPAYNNETGLKAMRALADMIHVHKLSPSTVQVDSDLFAFQNENALFHIQGSWMLNSILDSRVKDDFGVFPLSNLFTETDTPTKNQVYARSHVFTLPTPKRAASAAKQNAILKFIKYMGDHSYVWAEAGQIPASNIARQTEEYQDLPYIHDFANPDNLRVSAKTPYYQEAFGVVYERVTEIMSITNSANYNDQAIYSALLSAVTEAKQRIDALKS